MIDTLLLLTAGLIMAASLAGGFWFGVPLMIAFIIATHLTVRALKNHLVQTGRSFNSLKLFWIEAICIVGFVIGFFPLLGLVFDCGVSTKDVILYAPLIFLSFYLFYWLVAVHIPSKLLSRLTYIPFFPSGLTMLLGYLFTTHAYFGFSYVQSIIVFSGAIIFILITPFLYFNSFKSVMDSARTVSFWNNFVFPAICFFPLYALLHIYIIGEKSLGTCF